ncbi:membrane protein [Gordonia phage Flatwoods]|uniref:Uncharacterized protein n=2 Tax=Kroosvirus TaxID=2948789 RepID=A0A345KPG8_9CAUD|nr:hypothetical protein J1761_gp57 [Gordonia phage Kroos]YP_010002191.1 hypothetical protein J1768_gp57 [Gordonia phage Ribeye]AXH44920.1 hypothetical protein SEA_RIBEYE_57 [Gordonia phage Ribeye]AYR03036.1 hypothetical protein SEA_KROOS_57 [Gordonia phage Kroos]URP21124.1 membrane protein [Gordonia phage Flatwoods]
MNWRAAVVAAAIVVACIALVLMVCSVLLAEDRPADAGTLFVFWGVVLVIAVGVATGVGAGA